MKSIYSAEEGESFPTLIESSNYIVFKSDILENISNSSEGSLVVDDLILEEQWGWIYSRFSKTKLIWLRSLYLISYIFEVFCFVISLFLSDSTKLAHTNTPFTVDPYFKLVTWCLVLFLGFPFIKTIYSNTISNINLLSWNINLLYLPVYYLLSLLFIHRSVKGYYLSLITEDIVIVISMMLVLIIYAKIKYKDDGRYKVGHFEFFGVQIHFSVMLGCFVVEICEGLFKTFGLYEDTNRNDSNLFGWKNENWTLLVIILTCWTGCLILYLYKDVFYAGVLGFTYFGIFSIQKRNFCPENKGSCSNNVTTASITLGSLLFFFILITFITYPKLVLYSVRRN